MDKKKKFHSCRSEFNNVSPDLYFLTSSLSLCPPISFPVSFLSLFLPWLHKGTLYCRMWAVVKRCLGHPSIPGALNAFSIRLLT